MSFDETVIQRPHFLLGSVFLIFQLRLKSLRFFVHFSFLQHRVCDGWDRLGKVLRCQLIAFVYGINNVSLSDATGASYEV